MRKKTAVTALVLCLVLLLAACKKPVQTENYRGVTFVMNTVAEQSWFGQDPKAAYDEIATALTEIEKMLSVHLPESEIARLNDAAGVAPVPVSEQTFLLLAQSLEISSQTGGDFDITTAPLSALWDILSDNPQVPQPEQIAAAQALLGFDQVVLDAEKQTAFLPRKGMMVDLGGVAKGMAAAEMRAIAQKHNVTGFLSLGGNMMVVGKKPDGTDFKFGVRDPRGDATEYIGVVTLEGMTMATTGDYERFFEQDGVRYHHVLDPKTGWPAQAGLISATVISADGTLADALSTACFVGGLEKLPQFLQREDCAIIAVDSDKNIYLSQKAAEVFTLTAEKDYAIAAAA